MNPYIPIEAVTVFVYRIRYLPSCYRSLSKSLRNTRFSLLRNMMICFQKMKTIEAHLLMLKQMRKYLNLEKDIKLCVRDQENRMKMNRMKILILRSYKRKKKHLKSFEMNFVDPYVRIIHLKRIRKQKHHQSRMTRKNRKRNWRRFLRI